MRALCDQLGRPQDRYRTLHVVGTNGKSSVTMMTAALLADAGLRSGACISPHVWRWSERTRIDGREIDPAAFGAAIEKVAGAVELVEAGLAERRGEEEPEHITQFEAAIAASFVAFADAGLDVAVVEAGLGGRLDATNVIASTATALTSVGLDHVEWLGDTEAEIAIEKLAVLRPGTTLVVGGLSPEVAELARATAADRGAELLVAAAAAGIGAAARDRSLPAAQRGGCGRACADDRRKPVRPIGSLPRWRARSCPAGPSCVEGDPPMLADAAHNEAGARALAEALPDLAAGRPSSAAFRCSPTRTPPASPAPWHPGWPAPSAPPPIRVRRWGGRARRPSRQAT